MPWHRRGADREQIEDHPGGCFEEREKQRLRISLDVLSHTDARGAK